MFCLKHLKLGLTQKGAISDCEVENLAKKKNELLYLQLPLPSGKKYYKMIKREWSGLNKRQTIDTGELSKESNISTLEAPYLTPSPKWKGKFSTVYEHPISLFGFSDFLILIYRKNGAVKVDYISKNGNIYTGVIKESGATEDDDYQRSVVQFNVYKTVNDALSSGYDKKLLIFPDKMSMDFEISKNFTLLPMEAEVKSYYRTDGILQSEYYGYEVEEGADDPVIYPPSDDADRNYYYKNTAHFDDASQNELIWRYGEYEKDDGSVVYKWLVSVPPAVPDLKYAAVHQSRVFGVDDTRVYASGFNNYANWNLDTAGEYNESNAWCSPTQSNTKAGGDFTGITVFQNHVICFKRDFMHEIYNTKNPFRIQDIFSEGAIDQRTIQDVDGQLIFVSGDNVKIYTGSNPRIISASLGIDNYIYAVSGNDGRNYYLYCEDNDGEGRIFVYDTHCLEWSEQTAQSKVIGFAHNKNGMYALCGDGYIYQIDTKDYNHEWSFETDLITNKTVDIKHIKKIQMLAHFGKYDNDTAKMKVYILYDDEVFSNESHLVYDASGTGQKAIRVKPRKTASYGFKLHIEGKGYVRLYEIELFIETGGDLYV